MRRSAPAGAPDSASHVSEQSPCRRFSDRRAPERRARAAKKRMHNPGRCRRPQQGCGSPPDTAILSARSAPCRVDRPESRRIRSYFSPSAPYFHGGKTPISDAQRRKMRNPSLLYFPCAALSTHLRAGGRNGSKIRRKRAFRGAWKVDARFLLCYDVPMKKRRTHYGILEAGAEGSGCVAAQI